MLKVRDGFTLTQASFVLADMCIHNKGCMLGFRNGKCPFSECSCAEVTPELWLEALKRGLWRKELWAE